MSSPGEYLTDQPTAIIEHKRGDVIAIKTTGEIVYALGNAYGSDTGRKIDVRRPVLSDSGIEHVLATFFLDELESVEAYVNREATMQTYKIKAQKNILEKAIRELEEIEREEANKKQRKAPLSIVN
jgi:hypothetical protein